MRPFVENFPFFAIFLTMVNGIAVSGMKRGRLALKITAAVCGIVTVLCAATLVYTMQEGIAFDPAAIYRQLTAAATLHPDRLPPDPTVQQLSWFDTPALLPTRKDVVQCLSGQI